MRGLVLVVIKELKRKILRLKHGVSGTLSRCTYERDDLEVLRDITVTSTQPSFHCTREGCVFYNCDRLPPHQARHGPLLGQISYHALKKTLLITFHVDRIEDIGGIEVARVLLFTEYGTRVNVYLHRKHIRYFTA